jgi:hypothetical protein
MASIMGDNGYCEMREAVPLSDLKETLAASGRSEDFDGYCDYEEVLRLMHSEPSANIDREDLKDDREAPGESKYLCAKYELSWEPHCIGALALISLPKLGIVGDLVPLIPAKRSSTGCGPLCLFNAWMRTLGA